MTGTSDVAGEAQSVVPGRMPGRPHERARTCARPYRLRRYGGVTSQWAVYRGKGYVVQWGN